MHADSASALPSTFLFIHLPQPTAPGAPSSYSLLELLHPEDAQKLSKVHENATNYINNKTDYAANMVPIDGIDDLEIRKAYFYNVSFIYGLDDTFKKSVDDFMKIEVDLGVLKEPISHDKLFWKGS